MLLSQLLGNNLRILNAREFEPFVEAKPAAAIYFDTKWNVRRRTAIRQKMQDAEEALPEQVNFGEIDSDSCPELAKAIPVHNVPLVAYHRAGKLIAALIGAEQNVRVRLERLLRDEPIGHADGTQEEDSTPS
jgi:thioredoxin-like negative regulator of GroEL